MVRPLPVEGDAGVVLAVARGLDDQGARLVAATRALQGVARTTAHDWDSPAGAAFAARAAAVMPVVSRIATRYAAASAAVRPVAEALDTAQAASREALAEWDDAWPRFLAAGDAMAVAQGSADPAHLSQAAGHRALMLAQHERCTRAERRNTAAHELWRQADERCAVVLGHLVRDGLADPWVYDALTATSREAHGAGDAVDLLGPATLLPPLKWLDALGTAGDAVGLAADTALLVGYHQGSVGAMALRAGTLATGPVAGVLKRGATATNPAERLTTMVRTRAEARARRRMPLSARLRAGARGERDHRLRGGPDPVPRHRVQPVARPRTVAGTAAWAKGRVKAHATAYARNAFVDDWVLASRGGPSGRRMLVAAWTVDTATEPLDSGTDRLEAGRDAAGHSAAPRPGPAAGGHPGPTR